MVLRHPAKHKTRFSTWPNMVPHQAKNRVSDHETPLEPPRTEQNSAKKQKNIDKILQERKIAVSLHSLKTTKGA
jgi:hypothetical protein